MDTNAKPNTPHNFAIKNKLVLNQQKYYFVSPYGLGDTLFLCGFKKAWEIQNKGSIHFIIKKSHEFILNLYGITDYTCMQLNDDFYKHNSFSPQPKKGQFYIAHPEYSNKSLFQEWERCVFTLKELYLKLLNLPDNTVFEFPKQQPTHLPKLPPIDLKKAIFISASANSVPLMDKNYWNRLVNKYLKRGYTVINNSMNESENIEGCINLSLSITDIIALTSKCYRSYCLRSGLCDILACYLGKKLTVIYPYKKLLDLYSVNECLMLSPDKAVREVIYQEQKLTQTPLVSVVTPVYNLIKNNRKIAFERMLTSVANQTYRHIEHIIIDGNSNDTTPAYLKKLQKKYRFRFISEPDKGIYDAMNKGVKQAKGQYVVFMNSDDYFTTYAIEKHVLMLTSNQADFSFATAVMVQTPQHRLLFTPCERLLFYSMPFNHQTLFCKRNILIKNPFDLSYQLAGDLNFIQQLYLNNYRGTCVPYTTAVYDMSGLSGQSPEKTLAEYERLVKTNLQKRFDLSDEVIHDMVYKHTVPATVMKQFRLYMKKLNIETFYRIFGRENVPVKIERFKLFSILPIIIQTRLSKKSIRLFSLNLIKIKQTDTRFGFKLFGIPLIDIKRHSGAFKIKLFGFFNILSYKKTILQHN